MTRLIVLAVILYWLNPAGVAALMVVEALR